MSRIPLNPLGSNSLGDYLREQRQSARLSLRQLAELAGVRRGGWFDEYIGTMKQRLHDAQGAVIAPPRELTVWPPSVRMPDLVPHGKPRWTPVAPKPDPKATDSALRELVLCAEALEDARLDLVHRRATAERFVLSGGAMRTVVSL